MPKGNPTVDSSTQLAKQAAAILDQQAADKDEAKIAKAKHEFVDEKVFLPNALGVNVRPFLEARSRVHKRQNKLFEHPELLVANPKKDCHYGWARLGAPLTVQRAAEGAYRYVKQPECNANMLDMFTTHKGIGAEKACFGSLVLVEIPEQAWHDYYIEPEIEGVARLASQQAILASDIHERSEGRARMVKEVAEEQEVYKQ